VVLKVSIHFKGNENSQNGLHGVLAYCRFYIYISFG
jgi:hypothetical protein